MSAVTSVATDEAWTREAYERVKEDWKTLVGSQLLQVDLEPDFVAEVVLTAWSKLKPYRDSIAKELPGVNLSLIDKLEDYVLALRYVDSRYIMARKEPNGLVELVEEASKLRDILRADARMLALRGLCDPTKLDGLRGGNSNEGLADDLEALANELEPIFPEIQGQCATTPKELQAATQIATRLTRTRGEERISSIMLTVAALTEERQRAFTQVIKAYDEARFAVAFLRRREADADQITPNLYMATTRPRKTLEPTTNAITSPATSSPAAPTPGAAPSGAAPSSSSSSSSGSSPAAAPAQPPLRGARSWREPTSAKRS